MNFARRSKLLPDCAAVGVPANGSSHGIYILFSQLVALIHTFFLYHLIILKYMFLCLYYLYIYIYNLILRKLIYMQTWCNFKVTITLLFWQYLYYEQSSYVVIGLDL